MLNANPSFDNHLLDALPDHVMQRLLPYLERVELPVGKCLFESGCSLRYVYFPVDAIVSLLYLTKNGATTEIAMVGNEGLVGLTSFMGGDSSLHQAMVQHAGYAYRLQGAKLKEEFSRHGELFQVLLLYTQAFITQASQTAVCNRHHSIDQRLCRWLLLSLDRVKHNHFNVTQELIANLLGVRRESINEAVGKLHKMNVLECKRGHITILNRIKLEQLSCECYAVVKKETDRLSLLFPETFVDSKHARRVRDNSQVIRFPWQDLHGRLICDHIKLY